MGVAVHDRPKVGVVDQKWAWSVNFRARFARVNTIFYFVPVSPLINLATMEIAIDFFVLHYVFRLKMPVHAMILLISYN